MATYIFISYRCALKITQFRRCVSYRKAHVYTSCHIRSSDARLQAILEHYTIRKIILCWSNVPIKFNEDQIPNLQDIGIIYVDKATSISTANPIKVNF